MKLIIKVEVTSHPTQRIIGLTDEQIAELKKKYKTMPPGAVEVYNQSPLASLTTVIDTDRPPFDAYNSSISKNTCDAIASLIKSVCQVHMTPVNKEEKE